LVLLREAVGTRSWGRLGFFGLDRMSFLHPQPLLANMSENQ
jgi:hypothetical protein